MQILLVDANLLFNYELLSLSLCLFKYQVGLPTYGLKRLERDQIVDMNIGQLQVIVNDLCNQIESNFSFSLLLPYRTTAVVIFSLRIRLYFYLL